MQKKSVIITSGVGIILLSFLVLMVSGSSVVFIFNSVIMDDKQIEYEITQLYKTHLNREPDYAGMNSYKHNILEGKSYQWVEESIKNSEEAKISELYNKYLKRSPDNDGLKYYIQKLRDGVSLDSIGQEIKNSHEAFLVKLYLTYLHRMPDGVGLNHYLQRLIDGEPRNVIEQQFKESEEAKMFVIKSKITSLYQKYLDRSPDTVGMHYYIKKILEGNSYESAENELKNSHEAKVVDIKSKITSLYQKYLDRSPDGIGLYYYTKKMLEGNSYEWLEDEFRNSEEAKSLNK